MNRKALFLVGGLGLGNATRCAAVIDVLVELGWIVDVASSGNGYRYFKQSKKIADLYLLKRASYFGANKSIGAANVFVSLFTLVFVELMNSIKLIYIIYKACPDIIVIDSNYSFLAHFFSRQPIVSLNNSAHVLAFVKMQRHTPTSLWAQLCVELGDFLYQKIIPDYVLAPWPQPLKLSSSKFRTVEPIARKTFRGGAPVSKKIKKIIITYSGSGIGAPIHQDPIFADFDVTVIGAKGAASGGLNFVSEQLDSSPWINSCDLVITSGGFSSISECLAARKPLIVLPIYGHAEQSVNAAMVESLGVGISSTVPLLQKSLARACLRYADFLEQYERLSPSCCGAEQAADFISGIVTARSEAASCPL